MPKPGTHHPLPATKGGTFSCFAKTRPLFLARAPGLQLRTEDTAPQDPWSTKELLSLCGSQLPAASAPCQGAVLPCRTQVCLGKGLGSLPPPALRTLCNTESTPLGAQSSGPGGDQMSPQGGGHSMWIRLTQGVARGLCACQPDPWVIGPPTGWATRVQGLLTNEITKWNLAG